MCIRDSILRGVTLAGIDSVHETVERRDQAWQRLASDLDASHLESMTTEIGLEAAITTAPDVIAGQVRGRLVVDVGS